MKQLKSIENDDNSTVHLGDCLEILKNLPNESVDLVYLDPPFFTQRVHRLHSRDRKTEYTFDDLWESHQEYLEFLQHRLLEMHRVLAPTGTIFFHCDVTASHLIRGLLDKVFGEKNFRSEIIWYYRRWSNSQRNLLPAHQTIFFYSKTKTYKFNDIFLPYSNSTNVEQILQKRTRDDFGKSVYARDELGEVISSGSKEGVPLSNVWDIPYLNPKAKERVGYPTQKPIVLLERIIYLCTAEKDVVLDPFCGSGTTLVAASLLNRKSIGIDTSEAAVKLTKSRLSAPVKSESRILKKGREAYSNADFATLSVLDGLDFVPIHRNKGIDALLRFEGTIVPIRFQKHTETIYEAAGMLYKASKTKKLSRLILVQTVPNTELMDVGIPSEITVVSLTSISIRVALKTFHAI